MPRGHAADMRGSQKSRNLNTTTDADESPDLYFVRLKNSFGGIFCQ